MKAQPDRQRSLRVKTPNDETDMNDEIKQKRKRQTKPQVERGLEGLTDRMHKFVKWNVDNWICDIYEDNYSEKFCGSPQCRRCEAKRILDAIEAA